MGQCFSLFQREGSLKWIHFCYRAWWKEAAWGPAMSYLSNTANPESKREWTAPPGADPPQAVVVCHAERVCKAGGSFLCNTESVKQIGLHCHYCANGAVCLKIILPITLTNMEKGKDFWALHLLLTVLLSTILDSLSSMQQPSSYML